ncbi:MAG: hypothetical protein V4561_12130 [Bacteroidota bacterium]
MKNTFKIMLAFVAVILFNANVSMAAFPIKQESVKTGVANTTIVSQSTETNQSFVQSTEMQKQVKQKAHRKAGSSTIPQVLYILLAIFWLGWLAMGINDDWAGYDWLISLLLYILFWLPGFIFTLIKMSKYY